MASKLPDPIVLTKPQTLADLQPKLMQDFLKGEFDRMNADLDQRLHTQAHDGNLRVGDTVAGKSIEEQEENQVNEENERNERATGGDPYGLRGLGPQLLRVSFLLFVAMVGFVAFMQVIPVKPPGRKINITLKTPKIKKLDPDPEPDEEGIDGEE